MISQPTRFSQDRMISGPAQRGPKKFKGIAPNTSLQKEK